MGGKTQQRVAGNVKPSSSGRIRELLINKHGVGNIISFSTLSNSGHLKEQSTQSPTGQAAKDSNKVQKSPSSPQSPQTSPSPNEKPTLVVRRVGNRDCFTRIRVPNSSDAAKTINFSPESSSFDSDTTSTPYEVFADGEIQNRFVAESHDLQVYPGEGQSSNTEFVGKHVPEKDQEEVVHFSTLLDRLAAIQNSRPSCPADSLDDLDANLIEQEIQLMKILNTFIVNFKDDLSIQEWDFINRSLNSWIDLILKTDLQLSDRNKANFSISVFNFIHQLILMAKKLKETQNLDGNSPMLQLLLIDWENFYSSPAYENLIFLYFKLAPTPNLSVDDLKIVEALANLIVDVDNKLVISNNHLTDNLISNIEFDPEFELPSNLRYCEIDEVKFKSFPALCNLLKSNYRVTIVPAHAFLSRIVQSICENTRTSSLVDQENIDDLLLVPPAALMSILTSRDSIMSALLSDYKVGDISVTIEPNSDSYSCTLGYLFVWDLVIQFIVGIEKEVGHRIIHSLKKLGFLQRLLDTVFMLLPPLGERDSLNFRIEIDENGVDIRNQPMCLSTFLKSPLSNTVKRPVNEIELTALHVYFSVALHMPVTVRKWYNNNSNKRLCNLVNEYTTKHISKVICSLEMETVQDKCQERANEHKQKNLIIKARPNAREVYAVYTRDEFKLELTIKLPANYPLGSVQIDVGKRVGVTDVKWRGWLLQLTTFLSHQNGPILDGIDLWRKNIDKRFEGIEKCTICYSILHSNYQLPKRKCRTCLHMFHTLCLYKWFETSLNTTCPLCRNIW